MAILSSAPHACTAFQPANHLHHGHQAFLARRTGSSSLLTTGASSTKLLSSNNNNSGRRNENKEDDDEEELFSVDKDKMRAEPIRKFTGASSSPSLFTQPQSPSYGNRDQSSSPSSNLTREREREFQLAGNFERTIGIQAVLLAASFAFFLSVGLSGGITDGSDRYFGGDDEVDEIYAYAERYRRTDDAAEAEWMVQQRQQRIVIREQSLLEGEGTSLRGTVEKEEVVEGNNKPVMSQSAQENQWL